MGRPTRRATYTRPGLAGPDWAVLTDLNATVGAARFPVTEPKLPARSAARLDSDADAHLWPAPAGPVAGGVVSTPPTPRERSRWPSTSGPGAVRGCVRGPAPGCAGAWPRGWAGCSASPP